MYPQGKANESGFIKRLREQVLIGHGALGTQIQIRQLTPDDFGGHDGLNEILALTKPIVLQEIHAGSLQAGADIIETNTFGASSVVLDEYDQGAHAFEINKRSAELAKEVANSFSSKSHPRFVSGAVGPTTKLPSLGHIDFDTLYAAYLVQIEGLLAGGVDTIHIETCQDPLQFKASIQASLEVFRRNQRRVPIIVQVTMETTGTMLVGTDIAAALACLESLPVDVVGINCATGPDLMKEHVRYLGKHSTRFVSIRPNAGLPRNVDGRAVYDLTPEKLASSLYDFATQFGVNIVGGCCGTTPEHIKAVRDKIGHLEPLPRPQSFLPQVASLYQATNLDQDGTSPLYIGERTNANGSKKFRELLLKEDWTALTEMAKEEEREGAHVLDVCAAYVGRDEVRDMSEVLKRYSTQVSLPLMIDSTQVDVLEASLKLLGGRPIINSINLEDGEEKLDQIVELAKKFGAALVALTIDEDGMAKTSARKLEVATRIHDLVTKRHGLPSDVLLFDPLTFTIASGDEDSRRAGIETLEGIVQIKKHLPGVRTLLGLSNISFGLKPYARQVLNSVFLDEAIQKGLDAAILNAKKIIPIHQLNEEEIETALDLIYDRRATDYDPLFAFIQRFTDATRPETTTVSEEANLSIEEILKNRILQGNRIGIEQQLQRALETYSPLDIINKILLDGMRVVGELFGAGKMQLPFVLQSAETMKAAVAFLEQFMDKVEGSERGAIVLATVRGDVHDIGKNLVDIILSNNGYKVYNLGIKQPLESILAAVEKYRPDAVGLSGLLVKSTVVMKENLEDFSRRGINIPVICGGAALNRAYVEDDLRRTYSTGNVYYGLDAFTGLRIMDELTKQVPATELTQPPDEIKQRRGSMRVEREEAAGESVYEYVKPEIELARNIPRPPFLGSRVLTTDDFNLREIFRFINKKALFATQWQYRRTKDKSSIEHQKFLEEYVEPKLAAWFDKIIDRGWLHPGASYGYYECNSDRNDLIVYEPGSAKEKVRFTFPRQLRDKRRCIADYFLPIESKKRDVLAVQIVTMGAIASRISEQLFQANLYDDYLHFHGLSVESAEALAELMHKRIREEAGFAEDDASSVEQLFRASYRGSRYSFGYPACPRLEDQEILFKLVDAAALGVTLSEEFQLHPEQSTSALVVHHQVATYFSI